MKVFYCMFYVTDGVIFYAERIYSAVRLKSKADAQCRLWMKGLITIDTSSDMHFNI